MTSSETIFQIILYFNGTVSTILNGIVIFFIFKKATKEISEYKWYLLNFTIFDLLFDIFICFLLQPIPILPGGGVVIAGISKHIGPHCGHIEFTLAAYCFARCIVGLNYCFLYRFSCLCADDGQRLFKHKWFKAILFSSAETVCLSIAVLVYDMEVPPEHFYKVTVTEFPQQSIMFKQGNVVFGYDYRESAHANMFIFTCVVMAPLSSGLNVLCAFVIIKQLNSYKSQITSKTYQLHIRLVIALLIQTFLPILICVIPLIYIVSKAFTKTAVGEDFKYVPVIALTTHPTLNACVTLFFVTPFRNALIPKRFQSYSTTAIAPADPSSIHHPPPSTINPL